MKRKLMQLYVWAAALLVRAIVKYCTKRGRYVDYVHSEPTPGYQHLAGTARGPGFTERVYMRRYVITGFMTGDKHPNSLLAPPWTLQHPIYFKHFGRYVGRLRRWFALNRWHLYLHHMHAPDADPCLHDHPWPWGLSWVLLGGYREERINPKLVKGALIATKRGLSDACARRPARWLHAPALNVLRGTTFHRISELKRACATGCSPARGRVPGCTSPSGVFTLFLAGPRRASKPWGYLVPGRGFVPQRERHAEMGASERRAEQ